MKSRLKAHFENKMSWYDLAATTQTPEHAKSVFDPITPPAHQPQEQVNSWRNREFGCHHGGGPVLLWLILFIMLFTILSLTVILLWWRR